MLYTKTHTTTEFSTKQNSMTRSSFGLQWIRKASVLCSSESSGLLSMSNKIWTIAFRRRLRPLVYDVLYIRNNYNVVDYVFCTDLTSSHCWKTVRSHFQKKNIIFVEKYDTPANFPKIQPNERFWAHLKSKVYAKGWKAYKIQKLINRIMYCLKIMDLIFLQRLAKYH